MKAKQRRSYDRAERGHLATLPPGTRVRCTSGRGWIGTVVEHDAEQPQMVTVLVTHDAFGRPLGRESNRLGGAVRRQTIHHSSLVVEPETKSG